MSLKRGRYSGYIRPISYVIDLIILISLCSFILGLFEGIILFLTYLVLGWILSTAIIGYYEIYRFTKSIKVVTLALKQFLFFGLILFAFFGIFSQIYQFPTKLTLTFLSCFFIASLSMKLGIYYALKHYRLKGGSRRNTVIIGNNKSTKALEAVFTQNPIYGYRYLGFFTNEEIQVKDKLGNITDAIEYIAKNNIDDIYCSISELSGTELKELTKFANSNFKTLKFIPDSTEVISSGFEVDYYDHFPVLKLNESELTKPTNRIIKRVFDVCFSLFVIILILSWLTPILFILIKLESKGSIFYVHERNGLDYKKFLCYKFKSFKTNANDDEHVSKEDNRITKIGRFIRKTSIDELPQFYNVLKGDMSVVGPRPHMLAYNKSYAKQVDEIQFLARHTIKPGITGLAQIRGYRGEIKSDTDIIGRIKHDVFYIKNWSLFLDIKIIFQTAVNLITGEEKAY